MIPGGDWFPENDVGATQKNCRSILNSVFTKEHGAPIMFAEIAIRRALGGEPEVRPIPIRKVTLVFYLPIIIFEAMPRSERE